MQANCPLGGVVWPFLKLHIAEAGASDPQQTVTSEIVRPRPRAPETQRNSDAMSSAAAVVAASGRFPSPTSEAYSL